MSASDPPPSSEAIVTGAARRTAEELAAASEAVHRLTTGPRSSHTLFAVLGAALAGAVGIGWLVAGEVRLGLWLLSGLGLVALQVVALRNARQDDAAAFEEQRHVGLEQTFSASVEELAIRSEHQHTRQRWSAFDRALESDRHFLLVGMGVVTIPKDAFDGPGQERFRALLAERVTPPEPPPTGQGPPPGPEGAPPP